MSKKVLPIRQQRKKIQMEMYKKYIKSIAENQNINKAELKRQLALEFGYTSEMSVNTTIFKIERELRSATH